MDRIAIVVIAYNRAQALLRLLDSLTNAYYPEGLDIPLIISVDKSDSTEVENVANDYIWDHGDKYVRLHEVNLGLKQHVLECGDIAAGYDGAILLEDDLFVSPAFFMYTLAALQRTRMVQRIGGISLYNHRLNVHAREPFEAIDDGYDNYYMQLASSWGQAFSAEQWIEFRKWYEEHKDDDIAADNVPVNVSSWSDRSWLKYYIKYLIDTEKYFLYPRVSFATNFGDDGEHMDSGAAGISDLQVPLAGIRSYGQIDMHFSDIDESMAVYDSYFENRCLEHRLPEVVRGQVSIDIYGTRQSSGYKRYVLSSKPLPFRMLESYGRRLRPVDANVIYKVEGRDLFLYDTSKAGKAPSVNTPERYLYDFRAINAKEMISILAFRLKCRLFGGKKKKKTIVRYTVSTAGKEKLNAGDNATGQEIKDTGVTDADQILTAEQEMPAGEYVNAEMPEEEYVNEVMSETEYMNGGMSETEYVNTGMPAGEMRIDEVSAEIPPEGIFTGEYSTEGIQPEGIPVGEYPVEEQPEMMSAPEYDERIILPDGIPAEDHQPEEEVPDKKVTDKKTTDKKAGGQFDMNLSKMK
ncbi:MAG: glycosyltransferase [Lachnospiraceae bacterium]|nr:glycosyltransferase [Lachnospiraceae bacterium]